MTSAIQRPASRARPETHAVVGMHVPSTSPIMLFLQQLESQKELCLHVSPIAFLLNRDLAGIAGDHDQVAQRGAIRNGLKAYGRAPYPNGSRRMVRSGSSACSCRRSGLIDTLIDGVMGSWADEMG